MTQVSSNPVKSLSLLPAEKEFARCLAEGKYCMVGNGKLPETPIKSGDNANVVRGEVVRFFAYGGEPDKRPIKAPVITLQGAWILGELNLTHANIPHALDLNCCRFVGPVVMSHAGCGALYLRGSHLAKGLDADGLVVKGDVHLRDGFAADGEVSLLGANVGGDLACSGGEFFNPGGYALNADGLTTKGSVFMREGFSAEGEVRLPGANVGGRLICVGGGFHNLEGCALNVEGSIIHSGFIWRKTSGGGRVELSHAKVGVFADEADSWESFKVASDGFTYDRLAGPVDAQVRLDWLGNRPRRMRFSPLPYEQAAKVLFGMGHANDAREILLEKERLQTKDERTPRHHKIGRRLWDVFAGYGYRLRRTAYWTAGFVLVGALLFNFANESGRIVPHQPVVLANAEYREATKSPCAEFKCPPEKRPTELVKRLFPDYPEFNALVYSADVFIPFFALHQEPYWYPKSREMDGWFFRRFMPFWYWLEIGAGWVLTSLLLLSITGLLRPRQSSGEKG